MLDLVENAEEGVQQRQAIAERQGIPLDFMDQIMARLRTHGLIRSVRGRKGGIVLAKEPAHINLWDVLSAAEDHIYPVKCLDGDGCGFEEACISYDAWNEVAAIIQRELSKKSLADLPRNNLGKDLKLPMLTKTIVCSR